MARKNNYVLSDDIVLVVEKYERYLRMLNKSNSTIIVYTSQVKKFCSEENIIDVEEFDEMDTKWWLEYANRQVGKGQISISTLNTHIKQMSSFYRFLQIEGYVSNNPCYQLPIVNSKGTSEYKEKTMTKEQVQSLIKVTETEEFKTRNYELDLRNRLIICLMCNIAPRIGELSRIELDDIVLEENKIFIRGKGYKGEISRYANINATVKSLINMSIMLKPNRKYLFENYQGGQLTSESIRTVWYKACELCRIEDMTPHHIRHTIGSMLAEQGVSPSKIGFILGHQGSKTAEKYYIKPKENLNDTVETLDLF